MDQPHDTDDAEAWRQLREHTQSQGDRIAALLDALRVLACLADDLVAGARTDPHHSGPAAAQHAATIAAAVAALADVTCHCVDRGAASLERMRENLLERLAGQPDSGDAESRLHSLVTAMNSCRQTRASVRLLARLTQQTTQSLWEAAMPAAMGVLPETFARQLHLLQLNG